MDKPISCVAPAAGPLTPDDALLKQAAEANNVKEVTRMVARAGYAAPDFEATAYHKGEFTNLKLSDYKGRWVVVCFCPGDFTFV